jgi:hypothetical protein
MNNPCNDFNPTPLRMIVTAPQTPTQTQPQAAGEAA